MWRPANSLYERSAIACRRTDEHEFLHQDQQHNGLHFGAKIDPLACVSSTNIWLVFWVLMGCFGPTP